MTKRPMILRVLAGISALFILIFLVLVLNSATGNPISAAISEKKAKDYLEHTYPYDELEIDKTTYSFKDGRYYSYVRSTVNIDHHFTVSFKGESVYDSYEYSVLEGYNLLTRFCKEYALAVEPYVTSLFPGNLEWADVVFEKAPEAVDLPPAGSLFDKDLPIYELLIVKINYDYEGNFDFAFYLKSLHEKLKSVGLSLPQYTVVVDGKEDVNGITAEMIESKDLDEILTKLKNGEWIGDTYYQDYREL